jgi:hypothetical protein
MPILLDDSNGEGSCVSTVGGMVVFDPKGVMNARLDVAIEPAIR